MMNTKASSLRSGTPRRALLMRGCRSCFEPRHSTGTGRRPHRSEANPKAAGHHRDPSTGTLDATKPPQRVTRNSTIRALCARGGRASDLIVTRVVASVLLVLAPLVIAACGRDSAERRVVTVTALDQATRASHTARLTFHRTTKDGSTTTIDGTGEVNFDQNAIHVRQASSNGQLAFELILIGKKGYGRGAGAGLTPNWCPVKLTLLFDPGAVLQSLTKSHATLDRIGTETIRGVRATHYHVVADNNDGLDVWVDEQDRLRRVLNSLPTRSGVTSGTLDLYDFGESIPPIRAPLTSGCRSSGIGGSSSSETVTAASAAP